MKLLSQFELEQWNNACVAFDNQDYDTALSTFIVSEFQAALQYAVTHY
jgi:hypothetical protein